MGYSLTSYEFIPYNGATPIATTLPKYAIFSGKSQYKLTITAASGDNFTGRNFYFNPALFKALVIPTSTNPVSNLKGYFGNTTGLTPGPTSYAMTPVAGGFEANVRNFEASFVLVSTTEIEITFDFYFIYDIEDFVSTSPQDNLKKFTYNKKTGGSPFNNTGLCVYNEPRAMWFYFYIHDNGNTTGNASFFYDKPGDIEARFYDVGDANAVPDYLSSDFDLVVDGNPATAIGVNNDTTVTFKFTGGTIVPEKAYAILYRADSIDNGINFRDDVIASYSEITTIVPPGTLDRAIASPSEKSFTAGETTVSFTLDATKIVSGASYYIVILLYETTTDNFYTSHISNILGTFSSAPPAIPPDFIDDSLTDYINVYGGSLICALQERIKSTVTFDKDSYTTQVVAKYGSGTYDSLLKNVFIRITDRNTGEFLYSKDLSNGVNRNDSSPNVSYNHTFRIRHDEFNSWGGRHLLIEWVQQFFYPKAYTGLDQDHTDNITLEQFIFVKCYDNSPCLNEGGDAIEPIGINAIRLFNCPNGIDSPDQLTSLCDQDCILVAVGRRYGATNAKLIAYIDSRFYNADSIKEEEAFTGSLPQLLTTILFDVEEDYVIPGDGPFTYFKVDVSELNNDVQYRVSATIKYTSDPTL